MIAQTKKGIRLTSQRVTQVDLVSERVADLNPHKFAVPGSLYILLAIAFRK